MSARGAHEGGNKMFSNQIKFSKIGNGAVIHISPVYIFDNGVTELKNTLCVFDAIATNSKIRSIKADAATCKRCIKIQASHEKDGGTYEKVS
jgi:hypothetical protein